MDDTITPAGFKPFDSARPVIANTTFYAEYHSSGRSAGVSHESDTMSLTLMGIGPGGNTTKRVSDRILTNAEASKFTIEKVFLERPKWIDFEYQL